MRRRTKGTGSVFRRGDVWYVQYTAEGRQQQTATAAASEAEARKILAARLGELAAGKRPALPGDTTINDLLDLVVGDYRFRKLRSLPDLIWKSGKNVRPVLGDMLASRFTRADYRTYVEGRRRAGAADATINREMAWVRRGYTLAFDAEPPLVDRKLKIPILKEDNVRQGFLEPARYRHLLSNLPLRLKAIYVCAYHVATRKGELRRLRWPQVDWDAMQIRLTAATTKGAVARTVPIYGDMEYWLRYQWEHRIPGCPWVFYHHGRPIGQHMKGWKEACAAAGEPGLLFHDLRRSGVRNMVRAGNSRKAAMAVSGHKTEAVFNRYDIVSGADLTALAERTGEYLRERTGEAGGLAAVESRSKATGR